MAMTDVSRLPKWAGARPARWLAGGEGAARRRGVAARMWDRFQAWRARRETLRALYSLDVGTLRDLGISPREIESLVYGDSGDRIRGYDADWWRKRR